MPVVEYSFVLAGKYSVGKSSIFQRLKTGLAPEGVIRGMTSASSWDNDDGGIDSFVYVKEIDGRKVKVTVWDTGGQERYESMTANYYRSAHAVILVYAVDEEGTLYGLNESVGVAKDTSRQGENLVLALWGNKSDMPSHMHTVKQDATQAFLSTYHIPQELNCKVNVLDSSLETAMLTLVQYVDSHLNRVGAECADVQDNRDLAKLSSDQNAPQQNQPRCCKLN